MFSFNCNSQPSYNSTNQNTLLPTSNIDDNAINVSKEYYQNANISKYNNQEPAVGQKSQVSKDKSNKCAGTGK
jgi:hypothetical protein